MEDQHSAATAVRQMGEIDSLNGEIEAGLSRIGNLVYELSEENDRLGGPSPKDTQGQTTEPSKHCVAARLACRVKDCHDIIAAFERELARLKTL
jgi:hypothetical protein